ncbi:MAG: type I-U CRISPR-associated protein Cas7, partial [Gammaproteobacteria bacterium]|nr:type I-U CRISPR-associated protein Cas7 [Gammaproteobacteria bacterium]
LELGHRAADAVARSTDLAGDLRSAFEAYDNGQGLALARLAPTSIVFGSWDSRETQVKIPRLINSTIRAYNVEKLTRSAQYFASLENDEVEQLLAVDVQKDRKKLSKAGFLDAPSGYTHGGICVRGRIERSTILNLTAVRALGALPDEQRALRRYILGLSLLAAVAPVDLFLRQGCLLVQSIEEPPSGQLVYRDGRREQFSVTVEEAEFYAREAANKFGVGKDRHARFDKKLAQAVFKKAAKQKDGD